MKYGAPFSGLKNPQIDTLNDRLKQDYVVDQIMDVIPYLKDVASSFDTSKVSRHDTRLQCISDDVQQQLLSLVGSKLPQAELGLTGTTGKDILVAFNKSERVIPNVGLETIVETVSARVAQISQTPLEFREEALKSIQAIKDRGLLFETKNFFAAELHRLWGQSFGWSEAQCQNYLNDIGADRLYGLRRESDGYLIGLLQHTDGETTEWSIDQAHQKQGLVVPLILCSNADLVLQSTEISKFLWAHLRYDRSVSPALRGGMKIWNPIDNLRKVVLQNHVVVDTERDSDPWNDSPKNSYRSFVSGYLDTDLFTPEFAQNLLRTINH